MNAIVVDWSKISVLGDEYIARRQSYIAAPVKKNPFVKAIQKRIKAARLRAAGNMLWSYKIIIPLSTLRQYHKAMRAYRQLSIVLRNQGLNEDAARFSYRAQLMQRVVFRLQGGPRSWTQYFSSLFLDLLAGYGYKPWRSFIAYFLVIMAFAITYFMLGLTVGPTLSLLGAWVFSITSFHGRGFFPGGITLDDPLTVVAAIEAFVGLLIEVTFIATLTQRLFGK